MYASSVALVYIALGFINPLISVLILNILLLLNTKVPFNFTSYLNSDYIIVMLSKVNKLDLNIVFIIIYTLCLLSNRSYKKLYTY